MLISVNVNRDTKVSYVGGGVLLDLGIRYPCDASYEDSNGNVFTFLTTMRAYDNMPRRCTLGELFDMRGHGVKFVRYNGKCKLAR